MKILSKRWITDFFSLSLTPVLVKSLILLILFGGTFWIRVRIEEQKTTFLNGFTHSSVSAADSDPKPDGLSDGAIQSPVRDRVGNHASPAHLIPINTASQQELESLPGIGPKLANDIITYRKRTILRGVNDLLAIKGIGPKKMETILPYIRFDTGER